MAHCCLGFTRTTSIAIYSSKSHLILLPFLLSSSISPRVEQCFPILFTPRHLLYLRVHVLSTEPSSILFGGSFRSIFSYFYRPAYTTSINHHSCTLFSYIFTLDYNFGSFVSSLPNGLPFLFSSLSFFSVTDTLSLFFYHIFVVLSFSFILGVFFNYNFNLHFLFKFLLFRRIL